MSKKFIIIEADTNDADYVNEVSEITDKELETISPVIKAIKKFKSYKNKGRTHDNNFPTEDCCRRDLGEKDAVELYGHIEGFEDFLNICPSSEYGIHTIKSIRVIEGELTKLL